MYYRVGETLSPLLRRIVGIFRTEGFFDEAGDRTAHVQRVFSARLSVYFVAADMPEADVDRYRRDTAETGIAVRQQQQQQRGAAADDRNFHPLLRWESTTALDTGYLWLAARLSNLTMPRARNDPVSRASEYPDYPDIDLVPRPDPATLVWEPTEGCSPAAAARLVAMATQPRLINTPFAQAVVTAALLYAGAGALGRWVDYEHRFMFALRGFAAPEIDGVAHVLRPSRQSVAYVLLMTTANADDDRTMDALARRVSEEIYADGVTERVIAAGVDATRLAPPADPMEVDDDDDPEWVAMADDGVYSQWTADSPYGQAVARRRGVARAIRVDSSSSDEDTVELPPMVLDFSEEGPEASAAEASGPEAYARDLDMVQSQKAPGDRGYDEFMALVDRIDRATRDYPEAQRADAEARRRLNTPPVPLLLVDSDAEEEEEEEAMMATPPPRHRGPLRIPSTPPPAPASDVESDSDSDSDR